MANIFYGLNNTGEERQEEVVEGAATGSTDVEVRIDTGKFWTRQGVKIALEAIVRRIDAGTDDLGAI